MSVYYADYSSHFLTLSKGKQVTFESGTVLAIKTVATNKAKFSKQDVLRAQKARDLQHIAGHLSDKQLLLITQKNQLKNSPITPQDGTLHE